jgi:hypothetical protein
VDLSGLPAGPHKVDVYFEDAATSAPVLFTSRMTGVTMPRGLITLANKTEIDGWAYSPALQAGAASVVYAVDNVFGPTAPANVTVLGLPAGVVGTDHGFKLTLPGLSAGAHRVAVYVLDPVTLTMTLVGARVFVWS